MKISKLIGRILDHEWAGWAVLAAVGLLLSLGLLTLAGWLL